MIEVFYADCPESDEHRYGHALAKYAIAKIFGKAARLVLTPHKKPSVTLPGAYISISHSRGVCVVALSDSEIGVDIELSERDTGRIKKIVARFFSRDEAKYVMEDPERRFYEIWSKKEAYVKYTGEGFTRSFSGFSVFMLDEHFSSFEFYGHYGWICSNESAEIRPEFVNNAEISEYL